MIKIPSYTTAILAGAIVMPLFIMVLNYAEERHYSQFIVFLWYVIGFGIPVLFATADIGYLRKTGGIFRLHIEDVELFFIPTWKRMVV